MPARGVRRPVLACGVVGRSPGRKRRERTRHTARANGSTTSPSADNGGPGTRCPRPRWCVANWPGYPKPRWRAYQRRRWTELFWDTVTQVRAELAGVSRKRFQPLIASERKQMDMATRHCRPWCAMMPAWNTRPGTAGPPRRESARRTGLPQPHRPGRQPEVHRAHPGRHRTRRAQGQPGHLRDAGKQAGLGTRQHRHHPRRRGTQRNRGRTAPEQPQPLAAGIRTASDTPDALSQASTEELLLELRRRIIAPRTRRHETWDDWDGGLDPDGDWPEQG